jgi:hypothetical protein
MAHLSWKDSFLFVGRFDVHPYGFDTCGEKHPLSLEGQQALNLLTCCLVGKIRCHGSEEAFLRISEFVILGGGCLFLKWRP